MGEIGIPRHEFLYELTWWEINSIIRGYRKRNRLTNQLLAESVYATIHIMREPKKTLADMFPQVFGDNDEDYEPPITDDEAAEMQANMRAMNKAVKSNRITNNDSL